jgi:hypothetical protein
MSKWMQGDTKPDMVIECFDGDGRRPDLTTADLVKVIVTKAGVTLWEREVEGTQDGTVTVALQDSDTATPGTFYVKVYAIWADGSRQHYPPADSYMTMTVTR